jgi:hypothetical protein
MLKKLRERFRALAEEPAGSRFSNHYHKVHSRGGRGLPHKVLLIAGGIVVIAIGLVMLPAPGPGIIVIGIGGAMIAQESLAVAKLLDSIEVKGRALFRRLKSAWKKSSPLTRLSAIAMFALCFAALLYGSFTLLNDWRSR